MAATVTINQTSRLGDNMNVSFVSFAWDATYPAGGEAVSANQLGMGTIYDVQAAPTSGFIFEYVPSTGKIMAYYCDYDAVADGPLIEIAVGDTAILTGVVTPLIVYGF